MFTIVCSLFYSIRQGLRSTAVHRPVSLAAFLYADRSQPRPSAKTSTHEARPRVRASLGDSTLSCEPAPMLQVLHLISSARGWLLNPCAQKWWTARLICF